MKGNDIVRIHGEAEAFAAKIRPLLTKNKRDFLREGITSKAIPQPQLLVKDHKPPEEDGSFPTRLASDLKEGLEGLEVRRCDVMMMLLDIENMYPLFGMRNMLVQYHGVAKGQAMGDKDVALAIGAYEAAFCTDVVASYVFEMTEVMFMQTQYRGIYRDDGLVLFVGKWSKNEIASWLCQYQTLLNRIVGGCFLQFTTEVWALTAFQSKFDELHKGETEDAPDVKWLKHVKIISENEFPFWI
eukprot:9557515-Ditylum_brightwellii.AAC.1